MLTGSAGLTQLSLCSQLGAQCPYSSRLNGQPAAGVERCDFASWPLIAKATKNRRYIHFLQACCLQNAKPVGNVTTKKACPRLLTAPGKPPTPRTKPQKTRTRRRTEWMNLCPAPTRRQPTRIEPLQARMLLRPRPARRPAGRRRPRRRLTRRPAGPIRQPSRRGRRRPAPTQRQERPTPPLPTPTPWPTRCRPSWTRAS